MTLDVIMAAIALAMLGLVVHDRVRTGRWLTVRQQTLLVVAAVFCGVTLLRC